MGVATDRELITIQEAAARFGKVPETIRAWLREGKIRKYQNKLDRRVYVDAREIERALAAEPVDDTGESR